MLKKVKENKKSEIIYKINNFVAFNFIKKGCVDELCRENIDVINKYINQDKTSDLEIYIDKKKNYCFATIYFVDKITQETISRFELPNIF